MRIIGYLLRMSRIYIHAPIEYFLGFDLTDQKLPIEETNDQRSFKFVHFIEL